MIYCKCKLAYGLYSSLFHALAVASTTEGESEFTFLTFAALPIVVARTSRSKLTVEAAARRGLKISWRVPVSAAITSGAVRIAIFFAEGEV